MLTNKCKDSVTLKIIFILRWWFELLHSSIMLICCSHNVPAGPFNSFLEMGDPQGILEGETNAKNNPAGVSESNSTIRKLYSRKK